MRTAIDFYSQKIEGFADMGFEQRRIAATEAGLSEKHHTKTTLKEVFRVKPEKGTVSGYEYKNSYGTWVQCFTLKQCIPMRPLNKNPRTEAQVLASQHLAHGAKVKSRKNQAALFAREIIESGNLVSIDTETTDLYGTVVQVALVDVVTSNVLYESLVHTDQEISNGAYEVHGISQDDIKDAPTFESVSCDIANIMEGRRWTAFNLDFDKTCLENSRHTPDAPCYGWIQNADICTMYDIAVEYFGATNRHGSISLADSMYFSGLPFEGRAHSAVADAMAVTRLIQYIAAQAIS